MKKWQEVILNKFKGDIEQSIVVIDKDNLMQDDYLISQLQQAEYDILNFSKEVTFRNEFEERYRSKWDEGLKTQIVVIVQSQSEVDYLPYDLVMKSGEIRISLVDIFPRLHYLVVQELDKVYFQKLFEAHKFLEKQNKNLQPSVKETTSFILRSVFELDSVAIHSKEKLVGLLIAKHYAGMRIPKDLQAQIIAELAEKLKISLDLSQAMKDSKYFLHWLEEQWFNYVEDILGSNNSREVLDFSAKEIYLAIDNLLSEGKIARYTLKSEQQEAFTKLETSRHWIAVGLEFLQRDIDLKIRESSPLDLYSIRTRLNRFCNIEDDLSLRQWLDLGYEFAQVVHNYTLLPKESFQEVKEEFETARNKLNSIFKGFLDKSYSTISFFDDNKGPISLAKVSHYIHKKRFSKQKTVLLVLDGMAVDQWFLVRDHLQSHLKISFAENKCFAIAPTLTTISRQALFSGRLPGHFSDSLYTTAKEPQWWANFWINKGVSPKRIAYLNTKLTEEFTKIEEIADSKNEIFGIVVNFIDDLMHFAKDIKAGKRFFYDAITSYLENSHLEKLTRILLKAGYKIYITSDHGNIDGFGNGVSSPKDLIETYAKRTIIFDREDLAVKFAEEKGQYLFRPMYTPEKFYPVYPKENEIYLKEGAAEISHGGCSVEEMIVPFIEVITE